MKQPLMVQGHAISYIVLDIVHFGLKSTEARAFGFSQERAQWERRRRKQWDYRQARVLLVEDDRELAEEIQNDLTLRGYSVRHAATGPEGLAEASRHSFELLIIDRMLPELDGLSIIETLRSEGVATPVLVLSALDAVDDRVRGL